MRVVFILCDSVNRRFLNAYGSEHPAITPNIDRLAEMGTVFDDHWVGSAPCMPARRDLQTGRVNFLEKPWGAMEPFDYSLPELLKTSNTHSHIVTDHYHYLGKGGEDYIGGFCSFDIIRGQEKDNNSLVADKGGIIKAERPENYKGTYSLAHDLTYSQFRSVEEYPTPVTLKRAADWLERNKDADNFLLWAEAFDPHEPFDAPREFVDMYPEDDDDVTGKQIYWLNYKENEFTPQETRHLVRLYKAQLTLADRYIGRIFEVMDRNDMWKDTMVIFTTDHGLMLGEHGYMAKNYMAAYNEVFNIPLIMWHPDAKVKRFGGITQNIDMLPTLCRQFGTDLTQVTYPLHGMDLTPCFMGETDKAHEEIIYGNFGSNVNYYNGRYTYMRAAKDETNKPLNIYTAMPTTSHHFYGPGLVNTEDYGKIELAHNFAGYPVFKIPAEIVRMTSGSQRYDRRTYYVENTQLFDIREDYAQEHPIRDEAIERQCIEGLRRVMKERGAPEEQFERLGI